MHTRARRSRFSHPGFVLRVAVLLGLAGMAMAARAAEPSPILAAFDFERETPSGPDTYRLFEQPKGGVELSEAFRVSGLRSLRLREGEGDGSFSEFQGYIPERRSGHLLVQFYILFADPAETFNFALAGPRWFQRFEKDGHAFWLATRNGRLVHRPGGPQPGGEWQDLFAPRPFVWYLVDALFALDAGRYELAIYEEGVEKPVVELHAQRNTANADGSSIAYYSFIGDLEDRDAVTFFVDDILIATDPAVRRAPFVAPGRRRTFIDSLGWPPLAERERQDLLAEARAYLLHRGTETAQPLPAPQADRLEQAAGEAFHQSDLDLAEELLETLKNDPTRANRILLKLADVYHLRGWVEQERTARERIYGRLRVRP